MQIQISASADTDVKNSTGKTVQVNALDKNGKKIVVPIPRGKVVRMKEEDGQYKLWIVGTRAYFYLSKRKVAEFVRTVGAGKASSVTAKQPTKAVAPKVAPAIKVVAAPGDWSAEEEVVKKLKLPTNAKITKKQRNFVVDWELNGVYKSVKAKFDAIINNAKSAGFKKTVSNSDGDEYKHAATGLTMLALSYPGMANRGTARIQVHKYVVDRQVAPADESSELKNAKALLKKLKLPAGTNVSELSGMLKAYWSKRGGYAGETAIKRVLENAKAAGFTPKQSTRRDSPDGGVVGSGSEYVHPIGARLTFSSSYGVVAASNSFTISFTWEKS